MLDLRHYKFAAEALGPARKLQQKFAGWPYTPSVTRCICRYKPASIPYVDILSFTMS